MTPLDLPLLQLSRAHIVSSDPLSLSPSHTQMHAERREREDGQGRLRKGTGGLGRGEEGLSTEWHREGVLAMQH